MDAIQIVNQIRKAPQYKKHIMIMAKLSDYYSKTGHDVSNASILRQTGLSKSDYEHILAGSLKVAMFKYNLVLKCLNELLNRK